MEVKNNKKCFIRYLEKGYAYNLRIAAFSLNRFAWKILALIPWRLFALFAFKYLSLDCFLRLK